jgi:glycosyltransferase involved in cell wall biosynthesis
MRVVLVGPIPPPSGGMALQTELLSRNLRLEGLEVEVVAVNAPYWPSWVGRIPVMRAGFRLLPYLYRLWRSCGRGDLAHIMANSGWAWRLFSEPAIRIADRRGLPVVVNYRGGLAREYFSRSFPAVRRALRHCDDLIVPTGFLKQVFAEYDEAAAIVPNIVDLELFFPSEETPRQLHVVVTRNLEPIYDNASALRAFVGVRDAIPDATLTIAGDGPQKAELESLAEELGVSDFVCFTGRLSREGIAALLRTARVLLNPSTADNSPNSLIEAMASGVPIVSTAVGGIPQLCRHGREAILVPAQSPPLMAEALLRVHADIELRGRLVDEGINRAADFAWDRVWQSLEMSYDRARASRDRRNGVGLRGA